MCSSISRYNSGSTLTVSGTTGDDDDDKDEDDGNGGGDDEGGVSMVSDSVDEVGTALSIPVGKDNVSLITYVSIGVLFIMLLKILS